MGSHGPSNQHPTGRPAQPSVAQLSPVLRRVRALRRCKVLGFSGQGFPKQSAASGGRRRSLWSGAPPWAGGGGVGDAAGTPGPAAGAVAASSASGLRSERIFGSASCSTSVGQLIPRGTFLRTQSRERPRRACLFGFHASASEF